MARSSGIAEPVSGSLRTQDFRWQRWGFRGFLRLSPTGKPASYTRGAPTALTFYLRILSWLSREVKFFTVCPVPITATK